MSRTTASRKALMRNMATNLVLYEKIKTTEAKAKALRPIIEKYVTVSKKGDLAARRRLIEFLYTENAVNKMMDVIGPKYKGRPGGYTRITKIGSRQGDGVQMVQIEFV